MFFGQATVLTYLVQDLHQNVKLQIRGQSKATFKLSILLAMTTYKLHQITIWCNSFLEGIIFSSLGISSSTSEFRHSWKKLLRDQVVQDTFVLSLVGNPRKRSDESPCSQTLNFTNALECCTLIFCPHQRFRYLKNLGLILGDCAQEKNILVQRKVSCTI